MLGIKLRDHKTNKWIRNRIKVEDIVRRICALKWNWRGHGDHRGRKEASADRSNDSIMIFKKTADLNGTRWYKIETPEKFLKKPISKG